MTDRVVGIIAAVSPEGVIGLDGDLPWHYPADLRRFKRVTMGAAVVMGRLTWESLPRRPLPGRRNLVVTGRSLDGVEHHDSLPGAISAVEGDVWLIGGARIFADGLGLANRIDLTYVPDHVDEPGAVRFPAVDLSIWRGLGRHPHEDDARLERQVFVRVSSGGAGGAGASEDRSVLGAGAGPKVR